MGSISVTSPLELLGDRLAHAGDLQFARPGLFGDLDGDIAGDAALAGQHIAFSFSCPSAMGWAVSTVPADTTSLHFPQEPLPLQEALTWTSAAWAASSRVLPAGMETVCPSGRKVTVWSLRRPLLFFFGIPVSLCVCS
jgi:hypothetical protein